MRKLLILIPILFLFAFISEANAQGPKWPFGEANVVTKQDTMSANFEVETNGNDLVFVDFVLDSDLTIDLTDSDNDLEAGAMAFIKVDEGDNGGTSLSFGSNINATSESLTADKTSMILLFYDGDNYNIVSVKQID